MPVNLSSPPLGNTPTHERCSGCSGYLQAFLFNAPDFDEMGDSYSLYQCSQCGLVETMPKPSSAKLAQAYAQDYYGEGESKFVRFIEGWTRFSARRRAMALIKSYGTIDKKLRVLDIGCGRGVLLSAFKSLGHEVIGVERAGSPFEGLPDVRCGELAELGLEPESFDIVVIWHVLEHVSNPKELLNQVSGLINHSGSLFISVPNFGSRQAKYFKGAWFHLDLPRHLFHFCKISLNRLLADNGFSIVEENTFSLDQNVYGFLQSALNATPFTKNNHLYGLLKSGFSFKVCLWLIAYTPLVGLITIAAIVELLVSQIQHCGASLTVKAVKKTND